MAAARFCVECGAALTSAAPSAPAPPKAPRPAPSADSGGTALGPFFAVFAALVIFGGLVAYIVMRQLPSRDRLLASAPAAPPPSTSMAQNGQLPANHPTVKLPKEAVDYITQLETKAHANPNDLEVWNHLGDVTLRASTFDPKYHDAAAEAYAHVLKLDPDNPGALRGVGNLDFDEHKFDAAIAAYEHYLSRKPDDPDVRTDLATMYLSSGAADQAILQYKRVLESHPKFFEATFNLGVAYSQTGKNGEARAYFEKALKLAPDDQARGRVNQMLAEVNSTSVAEQQPVAPPPPTADGARGAPATFHGQVEQVLHDLPVAGDKVAAVEWVSDTHARVMMNNFPMDQMPPFAAAKFVSDLQSGVAAAKTAHKVSAPVQLDICDAAAGTIMKTVTE